MKPEKNLFEQVNHYLHNRLSPEERKGFERCYEHEPAFAQRVEQYKAIIALVEQYGMQQAKEAFTQRHQQPQQQKRIKLIPMWVYSIAAALLLFLALIPLRNLYHKVSSIDLYATYFEPLPLSDYRDTATIAGNNWKKARRAYNEEDYALARSLLEPLCTDPSFSDQSEASLYLGLSYMMLEQTEQALECLEQVSAESAFYQDTQWYTALALLKLNHKERAITALKAIQNNNHHYYRKQAKKIVEALD